MTVTIKDIAKVAGVSYSTVSKALNDSPLVKEKTKTKVLAIAQEMGYEPNFAAQRLVSKKTKIIGLIWPTIERMVLALLVTKISNEINKTPYSMILSVESVDKSLETFKRYQVDGVILFDEDVSIQARNYPFPVLIYGVSGKSHSSYPIIDPNHKQAILQAVTYLYELGHRKIAYIGYISKVDPRQSKKYEAFKDAMKKYNLDVPDESNIINTGGLDWHAGYSAVDEFLASPYRATAIVGGSYDISSGIIRGLRQHHIDIPKDISLISYDNIPQMATLEIPLTSVGVPIEELAKKIVDAVIKLVEDEKPTLQAIKLTPVLSERSSCIKISSGTDFN